MLLVIVFGYDAEDDIIGAVVGHMYYYLADVVPLIPETKGKIALRPPEWLQRFC